MRKFNLIRTHLVLNHLHLGNCKIVYYLFAILAVCKDEEGSLFLIKDENGWPLSDCMDCHCEAGFLTCSRTLAINFPGYYRGLYVHNEKCAQPQCNVAKFVRENRDYCEGNKSPSVRNYDVKSINNISMQHLQHIYNSLSMVLTNQNCIPLTWAKRSNDGTEIWI